MPAKFYRLVAVLFFLGVSGMAQDKKDTIAIVLSDNDIKLSALPYYNYGRGVGLTAPDSLFQFNIRFRMQNRASVEFDEGEETGISAQIRRLRLRFDGFVGDPKFVYAIQLSFAPGDVGVIQEGQNVNIIRDAVVFYRPNAHWNIGFGQTKLPGNRQRVNSSGALQLTDRTINNANFNIDRDFGLQTYYIHSKPNSFGYELKTAISTGEGRNWTKTSDNKLAYTGRLEVFPFGSFTKGGAYFEGDLMRETTPKLMLSGTYHFNHGALRTQGQQGSELFEARDLTAVFLDAILKYNGWSFQTAYMSRNTPDAITINPLNTSERRLVLAGYGFDGQLSYLLPKDIELIGRYSKSYPKSQIREFLPETEQYTLGVTKYIWEHAFKIQAEVTNTRQDFFLGDAKRNWYVRFQVEIGI
ncbi:porin [Arenibacter sp. GZD96]|uniref:porin n=1 Tax=Aurantibrevibacter litoralis TaxID=3106030 RepID=UPI002AFE9FF7|nr:porin [Arenibacter sp. GZD-96]MEA1787603.1 porin [Arenibacter sp. GZD-96]